MTEIKIIVDGIISQFDYAEEKISVHENIAIEIIQTEAQRLKKKKNFRKVTPNKLWSNFKRPEKSAIVVSKGDKKKGKLKIFEEIMVEDNSYWVEFRTPHLKS